MKCAEARQLFSPMLDSVMEGDGGPGLDRHLAQCERCGAEFAALRRTKWLMATMAAHPAPPELAVCLEAALVEQLAAREDNGWGARVMRWENAINGYLLPATAGLLSAVLIFGMLIDVLVPSHRSSSSDVPTMLYTPPEMTAAPFGPGSGNVNGDSILVEAVVDPHGKVEDYRVLNASGQSGISPEMKNALIFTRFRPATSFGLPTSGRVVISFSNINVGG